VSRAAGAAGLAVDRSAVAAETGALIEREVLPGQAA
jgi:hypothetical protein